MAYHFNPDHHAPLLDPCSLNREEVLTVAVQANQGSRVDVKNKAETEPTQSVDPLSSGDAIRREKGVHLGIGISSVKSGADRTDFCFESAPSSQNDPSSRTLGEDLRAAFLEEQASCAGVVEHLSRASGVDDAASTAQESVPYPVHSDSPPDISYIISSGEFSSAASRDEKIFGMGLDTSGISSSNFVHVDPNNFVREKILDDSVRILDQGDSTLDEKLRLASQNKETPGLCDSGVRVSYLNSNKSAPSSCKVEKDALASANFVTSPLTSHDDVRTACNINKGTGRDRGSVKNEGPPKVHHPHAPNSPTSVFEEAQDFLAQSHIIYLYASLRQLSATGRINTKFETLCIDSDRAPKTTAAELAGLSVQSDTASATCDRICRSEGGISPAQIMAILLIELRRAIEAHVDRQSNDEGTDSYTDSSLLTTIIDPVGRKMMESDMHNLLKAWNKEIGKNLKGGLPRVSRAKLGFTQPGWLGDHVAFRSSLNRRAESEFNEGASTLSGEGSSKIMPHSNISSSTLIERTDLKKEQEEDASTGSSFTLHNSHTENLRDTKTRYGTSTNLFPSFQSAVSPNVLSQFQNSSGPEKEYKEVGDAFFKMGKSMTPTDGNSDQNLSEEELLHYMQNAVNSREYGKLGFMTGFFKDGTLSQLMSRSTARVVWMNDWYPLNDLIYVISVDKTLKRVLVVFRGCTTLSDWGHALNCKLKRVPNPVMDDFAMKTAEVRIYNGFYKYLFRQRKDTATTKYDEICNKVHEYGSKIIGPESYSLIVTGHSLGGALSTVFGFYASTDRRFTRSGPVKLFTFGSPYCGGQSFADAFRYQEKSGKLRHARFVNSNDIFPHLPVFLPWCKGEKTFHHVGIKIELPSIPSPYRLCMRNPHPNISYEDGGQGRADMLKSYYIFHMRPGREKRSHTLSEHQKRMIYFKEAAQDDGATLVNKSLDKIYDFLLNNGIELPSHLD